MSEIILIVFIILNIILAMFIHKHSFKIAKVTTLLALFTCAISFYFTPVNAFKILILISAFLVILCSNSIIREKRNRAFEFFSIFLTGILASFCLINSNDFLSAFVSVELLGICCYFLTGFRKNHKSKEASLKYLITGASASTLMLLGISYLYGLSGSIDFATIYETFNITGINLFFICSCLLILFGIIFKLGCIPFINWVADIYEGASYPVGLYLSLIPKIAAIAFIIKLFNFIFVYSPIIAIITAILSCLSIIYTSFGAVRQTNIKRIYAYSSIIHSGFLLLAVSTLSTYAISTVIFYIFAYIFMNTGIWYASIIFTTDFQTDNVEDYKGLFYRHPYFSGAMAISLISLAGLPPTGGFLAKLYLFSAISRGNIIWIYILLFAMISTVIAMFVYFKIVKQLFLKNTSNVTMNKQNKLSKIILYLCATLTVLICIFPNTIVKLSQIMAFYL